MARVQCDDVVRGRSPKGILTESAVGFIDPFGNGVQKSALKPEKT